MDLEVLRLRRRHDVSLFSETHTIVLICTLSPTTAVCVETDTNGRPESLGHDDQTSTAFKKSCIFRSSHCAKVVCCIGALTVRVNMVSVHLKPGLYLDSTVGCLCCIPSVRSRRLERRTCCLCSVGAYTDRHKRPSLEESFIMHSRLGLGL